MIVRYRCVFGIPLPLNLQMFGADCEILAIEFIESVPFEWRILSAAGRPPTRWRDGRGPGQPTGFHGLKVRSFGGGAHGVAGEMTTLETEGMGSCNVLALVRVGTDSKIGVAA